MSNGSLMSIGAFALVSGLSISALRHYDEAGLLVPAFVDPATGYRRYLPEQVDRARVIVALRRVDLPVDAIRESLGDGQDDTLRMVLRRHREQLLGRAHALSQMVRAVDYYIAHGVAMPDLATPRIVQVTIDVFDLDETIAFYQAAFGAVFDQETSSLQFGAWPDGDSFMLTLAVGAEGPGGISRFGLVVRDVDAVHRRALDAGATEISPPADKPGKPRSSCVADPTGNRVDLYRG